VSEPPDVVHVAAGIVGLALIEISESVPRAPASV